jgi:hypothetical protein
MLGRSVPITTARRNILDLMYWSKKVPTVPVQRDITISDVIAARAACAERPRWTAIFTKAYALVCDDFPMLRRAYVKFPRSRYYEFAASSASIITERDFGGEYSTISYLIREPEKMPLLQISKRLSTAEAARVEDVSDFRRILRTARMPLPARRIMWWLGLNVPRQRWRFFGTYGVSVYSALRAESLHPLSPLTSTLNYGIFRDDGTVTVRIVYDHRVVDGAVVARVLGRLEEVMNGPIVDELRSMPQAATLRPEAPSPSASRQRRA